ncbi:MAG: proton-conducting transporter membrane subunit [Salinisphaera sp.]|jgi:hydrogenase-4 component B|nr:proton-conducting transporter membrane subunit [Salinisphaera sp.]
MNCIAFGYAALGFALLALICPSARLSRAAYLLGAWAATVLLLIGAGLALAGAASFDLNLHLSILPALGFTLDPLRGFFIGISAAVYGLSIAFITREAKIYPSGHGRGLLAWTTVLFASLPAIALSATVLSLIFTWEIMSLALWALISFDTRNPNSVRAGVLTLAVSEAGALAALAGLLILANAAGSSNLAAIAAAADHMSPGVIWAGVLLTFFGFGVKTGILPVNLWMNEGYAAAPASLRPLFSGATMNLGVFTLWIVDGPLASHALWPALVILIVGALTAILGIIYALTEHELGRLLTQSSIENLGVVVAALGAGFAFVALDKPIPAGIALVAALYHMLNHSAYKTLLFIGAGGIQSAAGTDDMDRLGGLMKHLPVFGTLFLLGALAIGALPPFNGFVSEWLTLQSLLRIIEVTAIPVRIVFALAGAALALTAGLALTCFIMLAGSTLLGLPRSAKAAQVRHIPASATAPMAILVVVCLALGVLATAVIPVLGSLVAPLTGTDPTSALVPAFFHGAPALAPKIAASLAPIGTQVGEGILPLRGLAVLHSGGTATPVIYAISTALSFAVIASLLLLVWLLSRLLGRRRVQRGRVWDAGLVRLRPEMTYNATGFAAPVRTVFGSLLRPTVTEHVERHGAFATAWHRKTLTVHIVDRLALHPLMSVMQHSAALLARMQHGRVNAYAGYVLMALVAVLIAATAALH